MTEAQDDSITSSPDETKPKGTATPDETKLKITATAAAAPAATSD